MKTIKRYVAEIWQDKELRPYFLADCAMIIGGLSGMAYLICQIL